jgi:predicted GIY-YIG superfamily endonuclease
MSVDQGGSMKEFTLKWSDEFVLNDPKEQSQNISKVPDEAGVYLIYFPSSLDIKNGEFKFYEKIIKKDGKDDFKEIRLEDSKQNERVKRQRLLYIGVARNLRERLLLHSRKAERGLKYLCRYGSFHFRYARVNEGIKDFWAVESVLFRQYVKRYGRLPVGNRQLTLRNKGKEDRSKKYNIIHQPEKVFEL